MNKLLVSIVAVVVIGLAGLATFSSNNIHADVPDVAVASVEAQTHVFAIENMTCAACPFTVKKAMSRVEGVKEVTVDFEAKTATAIFDPTITKVEAIANASTDVGYPATPIEGE